MEFGYEQKVEHLIFWGVEETMAVDQVTVHEQMGSGGRMHTATSGSQLGRKGDYISGGREKRA